VHLYCKAGGDGCKPTPELYVYSLFFLHQVMLAGHALGQVVDIGEGGLGTETLPGAPQLQWGGEFFLIHNKKKFLNFEFLELFLEGSRSTLCTRVVELVVMVTSLHLSYMYFIFIFFIK
jgi:hypothetical protein